MASVQTTTSELSQMGIIANRGLTNSQVGFNQSQGSIGGFGEPSTGAKTTGAVDTTASTTIVITGQKATAGETLTLESYVAELIAP